MPRAQLEPRARANTQVLVSLCDSRAAPPVGDPNAAARAGRELRTESPVGSRYRRRGDMLERARQRHARGDTDPGAVHGHAGGGEHPAADGGAPAIVPAAMLARDPRLDPGSGSGARDRAEVVDANLALGAGTIRLAVQSVVDRTDPHPVRPLAKRRHRRGDLEGGLSAERARAQSKGVPVRGPAWSRVGRHWIPVHLQDEAMNAATDVGGERLDRLHAAPASPGEGRAPQRDLRAHAIREAKGESLDSDLGSAATPATVVAGADQPRDEGASPPVGPIPLDPGIRDRERLGRTAEWRHQELGDLATGAPSCGADAEVGDDGAAGRVNRPRTPTVRARSLSLVADDEPGLALRAAGVRRVVVGAPHEPGIRVAGPESGVADRRAIDAGTRGGRREQLEGHN